MTSRALAISVLVCTRNRASRIGKCIRSILASPVPDMELLVIDQSDDDSTAAVLREIDDPRLRYLATPTRGLARARNIGITASHAPIVLFTDDDCYPDPTWVGCILEEFRRAPELDAVYGRVLPYGQGGPDMWCPTTMEATEPRLVVGLRHKTMQEAVGHGNNMAFHRRCFERHGLFLEWLGAGTPMKGGEDTDFSFRILRAGARICYSPAPVAYHDNWMPIAESNRQLYGYMRSASVVFTRFVLRCSLVALRVQSDYFRGYKRDLRYWTEQGNAERQQHVRTLIRSHAAGIWQGLLHALRRPPRYRPGSRRLSWTEAPRREAAPAS